MLRLGMVMLIVALMAPVAGVTPASAQTGVVDDVQAQLLRTDERIELAQTLLAGSDEAQAQVELDAAIALQTQARTEFGASHLRVALDLTLRARARADRAIAIARGPSPDRVLAQLERTRELIDRARDRIEECDNDRARALLRVAVEMQSRAEAAAREKRYLAALQLTLSARERTMTALRICKLEDDSEQAAERALQRTDAVIDRAREVVGDSGNEQARALLTRGVELQAEAWTQFRASRFDAAFRLTTAARNLAHRAIRLVKGEL